MERARPYLKVAAVASAVTLVGALVAYRAGAFAGPVPVEPPPEPQPATATPAAPEQPAPGSNPKPPAVMYGSKWAPPFSPTGQPGPVPGTAPTTGQPAVFIGGSKSYEVIPSQSPGP